jgi:pyridoxal 5'-phosphate synthase pdxT subunit
MPDLFPISSSALPDADAPTIGVLAVQGDVREHLRAIEASGAVATVVRKPEDLAKIDGLIIPGGESTAIFKLLDVFDMVEPIRQRITDGMPAYGSCAGMILLADRIEGGIKDQVGIGGMDATVRRNAFGRQVDSFEVDLTMSGITDPSSGIRTVFIRAPWMEQVGPEVEVLARIPQKDVHGDALPEAAVGKVVAARQGNLLVTAFHPEVTGDHRVHDLIVDMVRRARSNRIAV